MDEAKFKTFGWLCALVCVGLLSGCGGCGNAENEDADASADSDAQTQAETLTLAAADVTQVRRGRVSVGPRITGSTTLAQTASVRAELGGQIIDVGPQRGDAVKEGEVLTKIQQEAVGANVESAEVGLRAGQEQLAVARAELKRTQSLVDQGAMAPNQVDIPKNQVAAARAQVSQARAALTSAQEALSDATVRAPLDGVVSERAVDPGDVVAMGNLLFTVVDPHSVQLDATASAEAADALQVETPVEFRVRGYPERTFQGRIAHVDPVAQTQTRQIPIIVALSQADKKRGLVAGLFAEGRVVTQSRDGLLVSQEAITSRGDESSALVLRDGKIQHVSVQTGLVDETHDTVEILAGLQEGEYILVGSAARDIKPGTPVQLKIDATGASQPEQSPQNNATDGQISPNIGGGPPDDDAPPNSTNDAD